MKKLDFRIQRNHNLNDVYVDDTPGPGGGRHHYAIYDAKNNELIAELKYQSGPRLDPDSIRGILDQDLLEIARHRLQCFQNGEFPSRENACAIKAIEEALMWMNKRTEDRAERGVLGKHEK